jgi:hypothetical protein
MGRDSPQWIRLHPLKRAGFAGFAAALMKKEKLQNTGTVMIYYEFP